MRELALGQRRKVHVNDGGFGYTFDVAVIRLILPDHFNGLVEEIHSELAVVEGGAILDRKGKIETFPNSALVD
jgi:hypothetical protein